MTPDEARAELDRVQSQLAWHATNPYVSRPEVIERLVDRRDMAHVFLDIEEDDR